MVKTPLEVAEVAFTSGDLDRAETLCEELLKDGHLLAETYHLLGVIALRRKNPDQAVQWIERAIDNGLINSIVLSNCGEAYRQLGRLNDAYSRFEEALKIDNANPYAHLNLGLVMRSLGHARESEHFYRTALVLKPNMARAHFELAELYRQEGHWLESEQEYEQAIAIVQEQQSAATIDTVLLWRIRLASLLRVRGKMLQSVKALEGVLQSKEHASAHYEVAKAKFELAWDNAATNHYVRATQLHPAFGLHELPRLVSARRTSIQAWGLSGHGTYSCLARAHHLALPSLRALPTNASESFVLGAAMAPELGCATALSAEVLPRDFVVLCQGRVLVEGVVNWSQHYAQRGHLVCHEADDGRILFDLPKNVQEFDGPAILLGKADDQYAWLYECLARLWVVEHSPELTDLPLVVSADVSRDRLTLLNCFGISEDRLLRVEDDRSLRVSQLHIPSLLTVGDWISPMALQLLRRRLSTKSVSAKRRVIFSRKGLPDRRLSNEAELLPVLEKHGFEVIRIAEKSSLELLSILCETKVVIGINDDAMANLVVCPQGVRVGIIATAGDYRPRAHFICGQLAQELTYLVGETQYESNVVHGLCDIRLPEEILSAFLDGI